MKPSIILFYEDFLKIVEIKQCHYCDYPVSWYQFACKSEGIKRNGGSNLDRKDSNKPYTLDNIVVCCPRCNKAKNNLFSYEEWLHVGKSIKEWRALAMLQIELENTI